MPPAGIATWGWPCEQTPYHHITQHRTPSSVSTAHHQHLIGRSTKSANHTHTNQSRTNHSAAVRSGIHQAAHSAVAGYAGCRLILRHQGGVALPHIPQLPRLSGMLPACGGLHQGGRLQRLPAAVADAHHGSRCCWGAGTRGAHEVQQQQQQQSCGAVLSSASPPLLLPVLACSACSAAVSRSAAFSSGCRQG